MLCRSSGGGFFGFGSTKEPDTLPVWENENTKSSGSSFLPSFFRGSNENANNNNDLSYVRMNDNVETLLTPRETTCMAPLQFSNVYYAKMMDNIQSTAGVRYLQILNRIFL